MPRDPELDEALRAIDFFKKGPLPDPEYIETCADFLRDPDPPQAVIFPEFLPAGVIMLLHGEPRARKSLVAVELALAAATGTAPFGLRRFAPPEAVTTLYVQEEDSRTLTRKRLRALVHARIGESPPEKLHVAVRRGVNLDEPEWVARLIGDLRRLEVKLLVLDPARRLSAKTDEGPQKMRDLTSVLRRIVLEAGVTIAIVHHDVKPAREEDPRRRGHRASGGDWFAAGDCPVHVERIDGTTSLVFPEDYKFGDDPAPFTFRVVIREDLVVGLEATEQTTAEAQTAGPRGKLVEWIRTHGPATYHTLRKAGFPWRTLPSLLDAAVRHGDLDQTPGRTAKSVAYIAVENRTVPSPGDRSEPDWITNP
jgi:hypothetical protein